MQIKGKLSIAEVVYFIVNKPLVIVRFESSEHNKRNISKALKEIARSDKSHLTFDGIQRFLKDVAPHCDLDHSQEGVRQFLLGELEKVTGRQLRHKGFSAHLAALLNFRII